jgi:formamidopyrimidine-DNA glycosylase
MHETLHHPSIHPEQHAERIKDAHSSTLSDAAGALQEPLYTAQSSEIRALGALHGEIEVPRGDLKA